MIIIELRNDELRGIHVAGRKTKEILRTHQVELNPATIPDLTDGSYDELKQAIKDLSSELTISYEKEDYRIVLNLGETMTELATIPKVKDKEIPFALNSALMKRQAIIPTDSVIAYAVMRDDSNKEEYEIVSQAVNQQLINNIMEMFNELQLKLKVVDIASNAMIKAYQSSLYPTYENPLDLIVDIRSQEVRYYQFYKGRFKLTYLENVDYGIRDEYMEYFKSNVYQFLDEYSDYTLEDMNIILIGDEEIIKDIDTTYGSDVSISVMSDYMTTVENMSMEPIEYYMITVGASFRKDQLLSFHSKYDVNLIDKSKMNVKTVELTPRQSIAVIGTVLALVGVGWLGVLTFENMKFAKENEEIKEFLARPEIAEQRNYHHELTQKIKASDYLIKSVDAAERYVKHDRTYLTSSVINTLHKQVTVGGKIEGISYSDGKVAIRYKGMNEKDFLNYTARLKKVKLFDKVTYNAYSIDGKKDEIYEYVGTIEATLIKEVASDEEAVE